MKQILSVDQIKASVETDFGKVDLNKVKEYLQEKVPKIPSENLEELIPDLPEKIYGVRRLISVLVFSTLVIGGSNYFLGNRPLSDFIGVLTFLVLDAVFVQINLTKQRKKLSKFNEYFGEAEEEVEKKLLEYKEEFGIEMQEEINDAKKSIKDKQLKEIKRLESLHAFKDPISIIGSFVSSVKLITSKPPKAD